MPNGDIYQKISGVWTKLSSIAGTPGVDGAPGLNGPSADLFVAVPPDFTGYSWVNQGGASLTQTSRYASLSVPASGSDSLRCLLKAAPSTPWKLTVQINLTAAAVNYVTGGICVSDGTKLSSVGLFFSGGFNISWFRWNSVTSSQSVLVTLPTGLLRDVFIQIEDDGTTLYYRYSPDGVNFVLVGSEVRGAWSLPNNVGIYADSNNNSPVTLTVKSLVWGALILNSQGPATTWAGLWNVNTTYGANMVVNYGGSSYISLSPSNIGNQPDLWPLKWTLMAAGASGPSGDVLVLTPPNLGEYTWYNQSLVTTSGNSRYSQITTPATGTANNSHLLTQPVPALPWSFTAKMSTLAAFTNYNVCGLAVHDPVTGKFITMGYGFGASVQNFVQIVAWSNYTTSASSIFDSMRVSLPQPLWFRIANNGINLSFYWSTDGIAWTNIYSVASASAYCVPANVGFFIDASGSTTSADIFHAGFGEMIVNTLTTFPAILPNATPTSATAPGTVGQILYDASYVYICVATNTWKRCAISTF